MRIPRPIATLLASSAVLAVAATLTTATALALPEKPVTEAATAVTGTTAVLNGALNPKVPARVLWVFGYGDEGSCTTASSPPGEFISEGTTTNEKEQYELRGLIPHQTYTFCIGIVEFGSEATFTYGDPLTFVTPGSTPVVEGLTASGVTPSEATLEAQVNPETELVTTCEFKYGKTPAANEFSAPCEHAAPLEGHEPQHVSAALSELQRGTSYHYRLRVVNGTGERTPAPEGEFTTVAVPAIMSETAQFPTRTSVVLGGTLNPDGAATAYQWEYISQAGYEAAVAESAADPYAAGNRMPLTRIGASYEPQSLAPVVVGELRPETTYHYALIASNEAGFTTGEDATFTTGPRTPPLVTTTGASVSGLNSATITGLLSTRGLELTYGFQIGTEAGVYGPATGLGSLPAGQEGATVSLGLLNLQPGTTYHYRVIATNEDGLQNGVDQTFTTPAAANPLTLPFVTPQLSVPTVTFPTVTADTSTPTKPLTKAQKLAKALKACKKKPKRARSGCQRQARKQYGGKAKKA
jgi:trimeric autotransporter adhesin